jgi:hypothetical protein
MVDCFKYAMVSRILLTMVAMVFSSCCYHVITPSEMTFTNIGATFVRIGLYAKDHKSIPSNLTALPKREGYTNDLNDGWHHPLQFRVSDDGVLTISSLGRDGKPGGSGEDADVSVRYYSRHKDGSLWAGEPLWSVEAQIN